MAKMDSLEKSKLFRILRCSSLLDLALLTPIGYDDTTLSQSIEAGKRHTFEVVVKETGFRNGKFHVSFALVGFNLTLHSIFFKSTSYHLKQFRPGKRMVIQGKLERFGGVWRMPQPKAVSEAGRIVPRYKVPIKQAQMRALLEQTLDLHSLRQEGLSTYEAEMILKIHFPKTLKGIYRNGMFSPEAINVLKFVEAYSYFKKSEKKRRFFPAIAALKGDIAPFEKRLPFELSPDQKKAIGEIRFDIALENKAAKRLVIGDVGSGKTMVILAAVMAALPHKSILMAPTSLLALQLYEEALKYLPPFVKTALLTQSRHEGELQHAHFIIGTHALLYRDDLPKAPLIMVDEQHRFGTKQRHMLEKLVSQGQRRPHYIQFTATPIPRTQAMMESALIDVSVMAKTPFPKRIETRVIGKEEFDLLLEQIDRELEKGNQVLIVYPLVERSKEVSYRSIQEAQGFWRERYEGVFVTHGKDKEKEEVLLRFREEGKILLATTVVEVGISLPRLTLAVVVGAERLGLATLHQLRGRVGRHGQQSWCYLFTHTKKNKRLEAFAQTTDGFEIAKLDLAFRKGGDLLEGKSQSGQAFRWLDLATDDTIVEAAKKRSKK